MRKERRLALVQRQKKYWNEASKTNCPTGGYTKREIPKTHFRRLQGHYPGLRTTKWAGKYKDI